ncbi:MAG: TerB family tellurite resistance protein [Gammaproteobacteria bacterium]|nr:TerB family tellurite resistance protein [Gammaproteobacteria bacterium]MDH3450336.1 TerB family tellurite resistance protein [Gammaproteobacteria bacterium]
MFESLKHWFESLEEESKLFEHRDDEILHVALASVLYHVISADQHVDTRERHEFDRILKQEFDLDGAQLDHLYQAARRSTADVQGDLHTINFYLKRNPAVRMTFMRKLLQLIDVHGAHKGELDVFFEALHEVFPEVRNIGDERDF